MKINAIKNVKKVKINIKPSTTLIPVVNNITESIQTDINNNPPPPGSTDPLEGVKGRKQIVDSLQNMDTAEDMLEKINHLFTTNDLVKKHSNAITAEERKKLFAQLTHPLS